MDGELSAPTLSADVSTPNSQHRIMALEWRLTSALMGGTRTMRLAGKEYLPQYPGEDALAYDFRLRWSYLFNYYKKAVRALVGKPFARALIYPDNMADQLDEIAEDFDMQGNDVTIATKGWFEDAMASGVSYGLVDFPDTGGAKLTKLDEIQQKVRPYFIHIRAIDVIGWRTISWNGQRKLQQVRIKQSLAVSDGDFGEVDDDIIRVLTWFPAAAKGQRVKWEIYEQVKDGASEARSWMKTKEGFMTGVDEIPLVPLYTGQTGFMTAEPPLLDMAYINIAHWQSNSDLRHIAHTVSIPMLFGRGFPKDGLPSAVQLGPDRMLTTPNESADLKYVEHSGKAVGLLTEYMAGLEQQMVTMAIKLIADKTPGGITATEISVDTATAESALKGMCIGLQNAIDQIIWFMYQWMNVKVDDDQIPSFKVNMDFGMLQGNDMIANWLLKANAQSVVTKESVLAGAKTLGYVPEDLDIDAELEKVQEEGVVAFKNMQDSMNNADGANGPPAPGDAPPSATGGKKPSKADALKEAEIQAGINPNG